MEIIIGKNKYYGINSKFEYFLRIEKFQIICYYSIKIDKLRIIKEYEYIVQLLLYNEEKTLDYNIINITVSDKESEMLQSNDITIIKMVLTKIINDTYGNDII